METIGSPSLWIAFGVIVLVMLAVDLSGSLDFGTRSQFKREMVAEMAATIAFSAIRNGDKVGLLAFTDRIERFVPPRKGTRHVLRIVRELRFLGWEDSIAPIAELEFRNVRVPAENLLGDEGQGFAAAQARLGPARLHHCMRAIGTSEVLVELMMARAAERRTFGRAVVDYDSAQQAIARSRHSAGMRRSGSSFIGHHCVPSSVFQPSEYRAPASLAL